MTLAEFKQRALNTFGPGMQHATPANVREFLDTVARDRWREEQAARHTTPAGEVTKRIEIPPDVPPSYEDILRRFFADALAAPNEQALMQLWLLSLDLAYAGLEEQAEREIGPLFADRNP